MDNPKISVLIPMYNRKHYIEQCIDSALNQTFKDYEIIVRDNCSTDGGYDFVAEKYAPQISEGKIQLYRNKENLGEWGNTNALIKDASGKYIAILHSDDMYLPHALQHLYEVAEKANADVVHTSFFLNSSKSGIINDIKDCKPTCWESSTSKDIVILPEDPIFRFNQWISGGTFIDSQYNIFNRKFILHNDIFVDGLGHRYSALLWLMMAKVLVKTPVICYVNRDAPDSSTNADFSVDDLDEFISEKIRLARTMDYRLSKIDFFKNNESFLYIAKAHLTFILDNFRISRYKLYSNGITPELYQEVAKIFKKKFGENYFYPMFLFNWVHAMQYNRRVDAISAPPPD